MYVHSHTEVFYGKGEGRLKNTIQKNIKTTKLRNVSIVGCLTLEQIEHDSM